MLCAGADCVGRAEWISMRLPQTVSMEGNLATFVLYLCVSSTVVYVGVCVFVCVCECVDT